jgi:hypothetical protein
LYLVSSVWLSTVMWLCKQKKHVYLSNIPAITTENLLVLLLFSLFTTCFSPYGPSSAEICTTTSLTYFEKAIDTNNGSVVLQLLIHML